MSTDAAPNAKLIEAIKADMPLPYALHLLGFKEGEAVTAESLKEKYTHARGKTHPDRWRHYGFTTQEEANAAFKETKEARTKITEILEKAPNGFPSVKPLSSQTIAHNIMALGLDHYPSQEEIVNLSQGISEKIEPALAELGKFELFLEELQKFSRQPASQDIAEKVYRAFKKPESPRITAKEIQLLAEHLPYSEHWDAIAEKSPSLSALLSKMDVANHTDISKKIDAIAAQHQTPKYTKAFESISELRKFSYEHPDKIPDLLQLSEHLEGLKSAYLRGNDFLGEYLIKHELLLPKEYLASIKTLFSLTHQGTPARVFPLGMSEEMHQKYPKSSELPPTTPPPPRDTSPSSSGSSSHSSGSTSAASTESSSEKASSWWKIWKNEAGEVTTPRALITGAIALGTVYGAYRLMQKDEGEDWKTRVEKPPANDEKFNQASRA